MEESLVAIVALWWQEQCFRPIYDRKTEKDEMAFLSIEQRTNKENNDG